MRRASRTVRKTWTNVPLLTAESSSICLCWRNLRSENSLKVDFHHSLDNPVTTFTLFVQFYQNKLIKIVNYVNKFGFKLKMSLFLSSFLVAKCLGFTCISVSEESLLVWNNSAFLLERCCTHLHLTNHNVKNQKHQQNIGEFQINLSDPLNATRGARKALNRVN